MAEEKAVASGGGEKKETTASDTVAAAATAGNGKKKQKGFLSRIWNVFFRSNKDDLEKRLQCISKEEASVIRKMSNRSRSWRRTSRHIIIFSVLFEVIAVGYAIMTTRSSTDMSWKMRAIRLLPMFLLPALSSAAYSTFEPVCFCFGISGNLLFILLVLLNLQLTSRDQKTLESLRAERQAKIDELKEKTNYYITQQLIQKYDTDPAAKAAAATVLASKLGADSGLKLYVADDSKSGAPTGKTTDVEPVQSSGLRNRKQVNTRSTSSGTTTPNYPEQQVVASEEINQTQTSVQNRLVVVEHYQPSSTTKHDGGWIARIAALLVGEDPMQSYALICGNCFMHNGLARKEDFPYITYYCPHCHALNKPKQSSEPLSVLNSTNSGLPKTDDGEALKIANVSASESSIKSNDPLDAINDVSEATSLEEKAS